MMSAPGRILHVMRKDIRHARGLLAAWIGVIVLAVLNGAEVIVLPGVAWFLVRMSLIVGPFLLAAWFIREDPPSSTRAYWSLHPLAGHEVLAAKVLLVSVVGVAIPLLAQWAALAAFPVRADDLLPLMLLSAAFLGLGVLAALILGSVFRTFWSVAAFFPGIVVVTSIFQIFLMGGEAAGELHPLSLPWTKAAVWMVVGASGLFLGYLYQSRDARPGVRAVGAILAFQLLVYATAAAAGGTVVSEGLSEGPHPVQVRVVAMRLPLGEMLPPAGSSGFAGARVELRFPGYPEDTAERRVRLEGAHVRLLDSRGSLVARRSLDPPFGVPGDSDGAVVLPIQAGQPDSLRDGRLEAEVVGWLMTRVLRDTGTLAFEPGAELRAPGMRLRVRGGTDAELSEVEIEIERVHHPRHMDARGGLPLGSMPLEIALSDASGFHPLEVRPRGNDTFPRFPLPGLQYRQETVSVSGAPAPGPGLSLRVREWEVESARWVRFRLPASAFADGS